MKELPIYCPTATTLNDLVKYYKANFSSALKKELGQTTVYGSLFDKTGKLHPHQYHIGGNVCNNLVAYLNTTKILTIAQTAASFDKFVCEVRFLCQQSGIVIGNTNLVVFDIAKRLWPKCRSFGSIVYLYGNGPRQAARILMKRTRIWKEFSFRDFIIAYPIIGQYFNDPVEFENFLCVMRKDIENLNKKGLLSYPTQQQIRILKMMQSNR